jgi:hypothetical protein
MAEWPDDVENGTYEQLDASDTLDVEGPADPLDQGYSPPERPWAVDGWGTTAAEEATGESLDRRIARELPDGGPDEGDGLGDSSDTDGELIDLEVGDARSGRLVGSEDGSGRSGEMFARDVGRDGAGASAEEAAVHLIPEPDDER